MSGFYVNGGLGSFGSAADMQHLCAGGGGEGVKLPLLHIPTQLEPLVEEIPLQRWKQKQIHNSQNKRSSTMTPIFTTPAPTSTHTVRGCSPPSPPSIPRDLYSVIPVNPALGQSVCLSSEAVCVFRYHLNKLTQGEVLANGQQEEKTWY